jgi:hypothetical protein
MADAGFYKRDPSGELLYGLSLALPGGIEMDAEHHAEYTYPVQGWTWYDDGDLAARVLSDSVPNSVTALQALVVLSRMASPTEPGRSFYDSINDYCLAQGGVITLAWQRTTEFTRSGVTVNKVLKEVFNQTDEQIDEFFKQSALVSL